MTVKRIRIALLLAWLTGCTGSGGTFIGPPVLSIKAPAPTAYTIYAFNNPNGDNTLPKSPAGDGWYPKGSLTLVSATAGLLLYGRTAAGGDTSVVSDGCGVYFKINPLQVGSYALVHTLQVSEGCSPRHAAMVLHNNVLYSTTEGPDDAVKLTGNGTIVSIAPQANDAFSVLYQFKGAPNDGSEQHSSFSYDANGNAYGMSAAGGSGDKGYLYYIPAGSTTPIGLHNFSKKDGEDPHGRIVLAGNTLYGITRKGGKADFGVVFSLTLPSPLPSSSVDLPLTVLHEFAGAPNDAAFSDHGYLTPIPNTTTMYGLTQCGGNGGGADASNCSGTGGGDGAIFSCDTAKGSCKLVYSFNGSDGADPYGSLYYDANTGLLYGTTRNGGDADQGTVFAFDPKTGSLRWKYSFTGTGGDGAHPIDNVIPLSGTLYGMTTQGGSNAPNTAGGTGYGTIFGIPIQ